MPVSAPGLIPAISNGEVILLIVAIAIPLAGVLFIVGAANAYREIGKGGLALEFESDMEQAVRDTSAEAGAAAADEEVRQLLEAKAFRQRARGEQPLDVEAELERLRAEEQAARVPGDDPALREEVRQLVVARNLRRERRGEEPLDVEAEVERQLRELENLGQ